MNGKAFFLPLKLFSGRTYSCRQAPLIFIHAYMGAFQLTGSYQNELMISKLEAENIIRTGHIFTISSDLFFFIVIFKLCRHRPFR